MTIDNRERAIVQEKGIDPFVDNRKWTFYPPLLLCCLVQPREYEYGSARQLWEVGNISFCDDRSLLIVLLGILKDFYKLLSPMHNALGVEPQVDIVSKTGHSKNPLIRGKKKEFGDTGFLSFALPVQSVYGCGHILYDRSTYNCSSVVQQVLRRPISCGLSSGRGP